jgi:hypothetical protein
MLTKIAAKSTDAIGRKALELAVQLPEDIGEARAVLARTVDVLEGFLIRAPCELWNRPAAEFERSAWAVHECALAWTFVVLALLAPIGAVGAFVTGCESCSGFVLLLGLVAVSLAFG